MEAYQAGKVATAQLYEEYTRRKHALEKQWENSVDENGTFVHVFGDPLVTGYAVRIEVGYAEDGDIYATVDPASEIDEFFDDAQLEELETVVYAEAPMLDDMIARFVHGVFSHLYFLTNHPSFVYTAYTELLKAKSDHLDSKNKLEELKELAHEETASTARSQSTTLGRLLAWENKFSEDGRRNADMIHEMRAREQRLLGKSPKEDILSETEIDNWAAFVVHIARSIRSKALIFSHTKMNVTSVPVWARYMVHVHEINLHLNQLPCIPPELTNFPVLRRLILSNNKINGPMPSLAGCPSLEFLDCHNNKIKAFPIDIGFLTHLRTIDMEYNDITSIPEDLTKLVKLDFLGLTKNNVKLVPPQLAYLPKLAYLKLMHNPIMNLPAHIYIQGTQKCLSYLREYIPEAAHITASSLVADLSKFNNREQFSDIVLRATKDAKGLPTTQGQTFFAHRLVLDARCPIIYQKALDTEYEMNGILSSITGSSSSSSNGEINSDSPDAGVSAALSKASISKLPLEVSQNRFDSNGRLIVDLEVTPMEMNFLLNYIYGDVFEPPRPQYVAIDQKMTAVEADSITTANAEETARFHKLCAEVAGLAKTFGLPRLRQQALKLKLPTEIVSETTYFSDFERFATKPKHSDISFLIDGRVIPSHKLIVCSRSEYFNAMLTGGLSEASMDTVPLVDVSLSTARSILEFCYTDDVNCSPDDIMELLMTSRVYGIERLKGMVETIVGYSLDSVNAPSIYFIAKQYDFKRLKKACKYFILAHWRTITSNNEEWDNLEQEQKDLLQLKAREWEII